MPVPMTAAARAIAAITGQASQSSTAERSSQAWPSTAERFSPPVVSQPTPMPVGEVLQADEEAEAAEIAEMAVQAKAAAMAAQAKAAPPARSVDVVALAESMPSVEAVALPAQTDDDGGGASSENDSKMAQWSQVLGMMAQLGLNERAAEYLQTLSELQEASEEYLKRYTETIVTMDQLFNNAHREVMQAHFVGQIQARKAAGTGADAPEKEEGGTKKRLPRRPGVPECKFYMKTGACAYGPSCKWDHPPDRKPGIPQILTKVGS
eukprot:TRINITY_DN9108_c0_g1_i1.p1 TRINITY_DN9108_c0_g1~~TRINITY_DN9108_c0_g1_i1.p1  ORF type:complete len:265 (-),score=70.84 TRINITY_DN9108_c0_g1_i1:15-809(-)